MEGTTVLFTNLCSGVTVVSNITHHGDSFEGTVNSKGAGVDSTIQIKGRRLGDCP